MRNRFDGAGGQFGGVEGFGRVIRGWVGSEGGMVIWGRNFSGNVGGHGVSSVIEIRGRVLPHSAVSTAPIRIDAYMHLPLRNLWLKLCLKTCHFL